MWVTGVCAPLLHKLLSGERNADGRAVGQARRPGPGLRAALSLAPQDACWWSQSSTVCVYSEPSKTQRSNKLAFMKHT